jgi:hypothetical protein
MSISHCDDMRLQIKQDIDFVNAFGQQTFIAVIIFGGRMLWDLVR